jgi:hypothetical protein
VSRDLEAERMVGVFVVSVLLAMSLGVLVGAGMARAVIVDPPTERR